MLFGCFGVQNNILKKKAQPKADKCPTSHFFYHLMVVRRFVA